MGGRQARSGCLAYNSDHQVIVCEQCKSCITPQLTAFISHIRRKPHYLSKVEQRKLTEFYRSLQLRSIEEILKRCSEEDGPFNAIQGLPIKLGFLCTVGSCRQLFEDKKTINRHIVSIHPEEDLKNSRNRSLLSRQWPIQNYFKARQLTCYFRVHDSTRALTERTTTVSPTQNPHITTEEVVLDRLRQKVYNWEDELERKRSVVIVDRERSGRLPWIHKLGIAAYLDGLSDLEIQSSYRVPQWRHLKRGLSTAEDGINSGTSSDDEAEPDDDETLAILTGATKEMLVQAYRIIDEDCEGYRLTEQRAIILSRFTKDPISTSRYIFRAYKNKATLEKYFFTTQQLIAYVYRVAYRTSGHFTERTSGTMLPQDRIQLSPRQQSAIESMVQLAKKTKDITSKDLHHAIISTFERLISHHLGSHKFSSPIVSFTAMLARKHSRRRRDGQGEGVAHSIWQDITTFSSRISALIWCAQLVIFQDICAQYEEDAENPLQVVDALSEYMEQYFQQEKETPLGYLLYWRVTLFNLAPYNMAIKQARWSPNFEYIDMDGIRLYMRELQQLVRNTFTAAAQVLYQQLLFGAVQLGKLANVQAFALEDSLDDRTYGTSWLDHTANLAYTKNHKTALLDYIQGSPELRQVFFQQKRDGDAAINPTAISAYEADVQLFLGRLLVLCHVPPGPPLRAPEILSVDTANTGSMRHIYIWAKQVAIHTTYHKSQEMKGRGRDNIRFLPNEIGNLILLYTLYVLPLRKLFFQERHPERRLGTRLWTDQKGNPWQDTQLTAQIKSTCALAGVPVITSAWWRHIAAAITKDLFTKQELEGFGNTFDDEHVAEDQPDMVQLATMSNHSFRTMSMAYAGSTGGIVTTFLHRALQASRVWAARLQLVQAIQDGDTLTSQPIRYNLGLLRANRARPVYSEREVLAKASQLYKSDGLVFKNQGQQEAVRAICGDNSADQVLVIMATGSGKTLPVLVPSQMTGAGTTIIIMSTVALRISMIRQMGSMGIKWEEWTSQASPALARNIVLVSAEAVSNTSKFMDYCWRLNELGRLDRIVMDECHLTLTARYRESMGSIGSSIRQIKTQTIWLTGSLMPSMEASLLYTNKLVSPLVIRHSTNRPNLHYRITIQPGPEKDRGSSTPEWMFGQLEHRISHMKRYIRKQKGGYDLASRAIIYWPTVKETREFASHIGSAYVTGDQTLEEKTQAIQGWIEGHSSPVISATSALGIGFDYSNIRAILHAGPPRKITDYSQETGRAGRDGKPATVEVLAGHDWAQALSGSKDDDDTHAMYLVMKKLHCVRGILSQYLDQSTDWLYCTKEQALCWYCRGLTAIEPRPAGRILGLHTEVQYTGRAEVIRQSKEKEEAEQAYRYLMEVSAATCLYCRVLGQSFHHSPTLCSSRNDWIQVKTDTVKRKGRSWMPQFSVCFQCYHPQFICKAGFSGVPCELPDQVLPACISVYIRPGGKEWLRDRFNCPVDSMSSYMGWLGGQCSIGGKKAAKCNIVIYSLLAQKGA